MLHYHSTVLYKNTVLPAKYRRTRYWVTALAGEYWLQIH